MEVEAGIGGIVRQPFYRGHGRHGHERRRRVIHCATNDSENSPGLGLAPIPDATHCQAQNGGSEAASFSSRSWALPQNLWRRGHLCRRRILLSCRVRCGDVSLQLRRSTNHLPGSISPILERLTPACSLCFWAAPATSDAAAVLLPWKPILTPHCFELVVKNNILYSSPKTREAMDEEQQAEMASPPPKDAFNLAYMSFFVLGAGFLLPWNAFITAVDYFDFLYPNTHIDRVFSIAYMFPAFFLLLYLTIQGRFFNPRLRINSGLVLYLAMMLIVPMMDEIGIRDHGGGAPSSSSTRATHYVTIAAVSITGLADALVQGSLVGSAGELPERYMQALVAGTAASGVLVSGLRIATKAALPPSPDGLRKSANVYFIASVIFMVICLISYNLVNNLPVVRYHLKHNSTATDSAPLLEDGNVKGTAVSYMQVWKQIKGLMLSLSLIYLVTLAIFPGSLTEDVHSQTLGNWFPVLLIACYNVGDLVGKGLTAICLVDNTSLMIWGSLARLLFFPLFALCLHGPSWLRTEVPVFVITSLLGISNGYLTSVIMIKAPKLVSLPEAETAGIMTVVFLMAGLTSGSLLGWIWVL